MSTSMLEEYVATLVDPRGEPVVRELDRVIMATQPDLDLAIKYKILMYALKGDFHTWVCSINARRRKVALHFLYGVLLDDAKKVLRAGSSVLMTWVSASMRTSTPRRWRPTSPRPSGATRTTSPTAKASWIGVARLRPRQADAPRQGAHKPHLCSCTDGVSFVTPDNGRLCHGADDARSVHEH
jgi:hypothetical protein